MVAALLLLGVGLLWPHWFTPAEVWSLEQAREYEAAFTALHAATAPPPPSRASNSPGGVPAQGPSPQELAALKSRYERIRAQLDDAREFRGEVGPRLVRIALVGLVGFGIGYLLSPRSD
jgi:hypothetical protein